MRSGNRASGYPGRPHATTRRREGRAIEPDRKETQNTRDLLAELAQQPDTLFRAPFRMQYAALCYRRGFEGVEVLLVTTRASGRWIIPKGWPIDDKPPHKVAAQEAFEEAGVLGKAKRKPFGRYTYLKTLADGQRVPCLVQVHLVKFAEELPRFREAGERRVEWVSCIEAARRICEPELKGLMLALYRKEEVKERNRRGVPN